jgi:hypothetical protein
MKTWLVTAAITCTSATACFADGGYWVVGNNQTNTCEIVTSNPVLTPAGPLYFGTGPYNSLKDAKLARSTISRCPKVPDKDDEDDQ